jgi:DNA adenine methylase
VRRPHPIPYQGSKRRLAHQIGCYIPQQIDTWYEPFAGSAAMTLWAAQNRPLRRIVMGDSLDALAALWRQIIDAPEVTSAKYRAVWLAQTAGETGYFNTVRARFNRFRDPVDLLYLMCRCVKNAIRFNPRGEFTQSVDHRRLGMQPDRMAQAMLGASVLLRGRTEIRSADWLDTLAPAQAADFIYLDPPYFGTSEGRDRRYAASLPRADLMLGLTELRERRLRFVLSYDGSTGGRNYAETLPEELGLRRISLPAGRSSQATLHGRSAETIESLYLNGFGSGHETSG